MVTVQAEACTECGEPYYSSDTLRYLGRRLNLGSFDGGQ
jgi:hypothetical protein